MGGRILTDGATMVCMGALHAGVDYFVGYPITPASGILSGMVRQGVGIEAPDEITAFQYLIGGALNGHKAMTATSGPGFLLMAEGIGAAFAMEVPLTVVLVQRLGPATGSATWNAQGDIHMAENIISGGFVLPMICPSTLEECVEMTALAVNISEMLRVPSILLTEKDMIMTKRTVADVPLPPVVDRKICTSDPAGYTPYGRLDEYDVPMFRELGDLETQVRITASTHDENGIISPLTEKVRWNTERLLIRKNLSLFPEALTDLQDGAQTMIVTYGYTAYAAREAVQQLRAEGRKVSLLVVRTLFPVLTDSIDRQLGGVRRVLVAEENLTGQYREVLLGKGLLRNRPEVEIAGINAMGCSITPEQIMAAVRQEVRG